MNLEIGVSIAGSIFGILGVSLSYVCYRTFKQHRELLEFLAKQNDELQETLLKNKEKMEAVSKLASDQLRRIAWLETRIRQPKISSEEILKEPTSNNSLKFNITERRHRVLTLASRGQDSKKIAATLGMMPGEVELIINLNRAAAV
jgi:DNA-binding NarL/FixJ family response regulator